MGEERKDGSHENAATESRQKAKYPHLLDDRGRIVRWPRKADEKRFVLELLQSKFVRGMTYTEQEVNAVIREWHRFDDHALLRREMFDRYLLNRTNDGRKYWI